MVELIEWLDRRWGCFHLMGLIQWEDGHGSRLFESKARRRGRMWGRILAKWDVQVPCRRCAIGMWDLHVSYAMSCVWDHWHVEPAGAIRYAMRAM